MRLFVFVYRKTFTASTAENIGARDSSLKLVISRLLEGSWREREVATKLQLER